MSIVLGSDLANVCTKYCKHFAFIPRAAIANTTDMVDKTTEIVSLTLQFWKSQTKVSVDKGRGLSKSSGRKACGSNFLWLAAEQEEISNFIFRWLFLLCLWRSFSVSSKNILVRFRIHSKPIMISAWFLTALQIPYFEIKSQSELLSGEEFGGTIFQHIVFLSRPEPLTI